MTEKRNKDRNVPTLRFPGFDDDWTSKKLSDVCEVVMGQSPESNAYNIEGNGLPLIQGNADIQNRYTKPRNFTTSITKICEVGDLILTVRAPVGSIAKSNLKACIGRGVCSIRVNQTHNSEFVYQFLMNFESKWISIEQGSTFTSVSGTEIKNVKINLPCIEEQLKIAKFLSLLDDRIETQNKIIEHLESLIKALKATMLNSELRFKKETGAHFPNWEFKTLLDIAIKKSSNISANTLENESGKYKIYGANGVLKKISYYREEQHYISIVKDGAGVGRLYYCEGKTSVLGTLDIIKNKECVDLKYLYYLLDSIDFSKYKTGSTIPHIYFKDYSAETIHLPCLEEQKMISNFLFSIDMKIELERNLLNKYSTKKKFMQNCLFT